MPVAFSSLRTAAVAAALVAWPVMGWADGLQLQGEGVDLAVRTTVTNPGAPAVGSQINLTTQIENLHAQAQVGFDAGQKVVDESWLWIPSAPLEAGRWDSRQLSLGATWTPSPQAKVELSANSQARTERDRADPIWTAWSAQSLRSRQSVARVALTLTPWAPLNLQVGGQSTDGAVDAATVSSASAPTSDLLRTQGQQVFTAVTWRPLPKLSLEGGGKAETLDVSWEGAGARTGSYAYVEPRLAGTLTPWAGASWRLGVERAVAPLNTAQYLAYAQAAELASGPMFGPDQEWRYEASLQQRLAGDIDLSARIMRARLQNVTDLGPVGALQAPIDIGRGERSQIEANVAAPLHMFGWPALTLKAKAAWRDSQVIDPFSGQPRRISGETPYDAEVTLAGVAGPAMRWGVTARSGGSAMIYQMSQVTSYSPVGGVGGFLEYNPGPISVRLNLDNLLGGERTTRDIYYSGARDRGVVDRVDESRTSDRAIRLLFSKPL
jgi:hypothetical protein